MAARMAEVREEDAAAEVRALYDDIRRATGTPQVNLIFRHLALEPPVLEWCWRTIAPLYRDGGIAAAAARLHAGVSVPRRPPVWQGTGADEATTIRAVLAFYERGNSSNLVGLSTLLRVAGGAGGRPATAGPAPRNAAQAGGEPAPVPPLPRPDTVPPELMALVAELSERQGTADFGVLPSLWLHLTLWPEAMRRAHATVAPMLETPEWRRSVDSLLDRAGTLADALAAGVEIPSPAPPDEVLRGYLGTVERFVGTAIPQMVLAGRVLAGGDPVALAPRA